MKLEKITKELENKSTGKKKIDTNSLLIQKLLKNSNLNVSIYFPNSEGRITIHISKEFCITSPDKFKWEITITSIRDEVLFKEVHPNIDEFDMDTILDRVYQLSNKYVILKSY